MCDFANVILENCHLFLATFRRWTSRISIESLIDNPDKDTIAVFAFLEDIGNGFDTAFVAITCDRHEDCVDVETQS